MKVVLASVFSFAIVSLFVAFVYFLSTIVIGISHVHIHMVDIGVILAAYIMTAIFLYGHLSVRER